MPCGSQYSELPQSDSITVCTVLVPYSVCAVLVPYNVCIILVTCSMYSTGDVQRVQYWCWFVVFVLLRKYYGFTESFPTCQMLTRSETGKKRNFYFASNLLRELTIRNEHTVKVCQRMAPLRRTCYVRSC